MSSPRSRPATPASRSRKRASSMSSPARSASSISPRWRRALPASTSISARRPSATRGASRSGVVAGIGAWNYPLQIACWKSAPALAFGNAMIFKPAELTPLTAVRAREDLSRGRLAGRHLPGRAGTFRTGRLLTRHPAIRKVSLTGEVGTGKAVMTRRREHAQGRDARARRQVAADRVRRCEARPGRLRRAARQFLFRRRGVLERHAGLRARAVDAEFMPQARRARRAR